MYCQNLFEQLNFQPGIAPEFPLDFYSHQKQRPFDTFFLENREPQKLDPDWEMAALPWNTFSAEGETCDIALANLTIQIELAMLRLVFTSAGKTYFTDAKPESVIPLWARSVDKALEPEMIRRRIHPNAVTTCLYKGSTILVHNKADAFVDCLLGDPVCLPGKNGMWKAEQRRAIGVLDNRNVAIVVPK